jgi:hypothetical protein
MRRRVPGKAAIERFMKEQSMTEMKRRQALRGAAFVGLGFVGADDGAAGADAPQERAPDTDRGRVIAAGMTEAEAECWELAAKTAGRYFDLPELHPMDRQEIASAIHIIQNKLLSRPTYRRYLELAKASEKRERGAP